MFGRIALVALFCAPFCAPFLLSELCDESLLDGKVIAGFYRGHFFYFVYGWNADTAKQRSMDPESIFGTDRYATLPEVQATPTDILPLSANRVALFFTYNDKFLVSFYELNNFRSDGLATTHDPLMFPVRVAEGDEPFPVKSLDRKLVKYTNGKMVIDNWEFPVDEDGKGHHFVTSYGKPNDGPNNFSRIYNNSTTQFDHKVDRYTTYYMHYDFIAKKTCKLFIVKGRTATSEFSHLQILPDYAANTSHVASANFAVIFPTTTESPEGELKHPRDPTQTVPNHDQSMELQGISKSEIPRPFDVLLAVIFLALFCILLLVGLAVFLVYYCKKSKKADYQFDKEFRKESNIESQSSGPASVSEKGDSSRKQ